MREPRREMRPPIGPSVDPRTKLLLLFTLPTFLFSGAGGDYFLPVRIILSILPFGLLCLSGNQRKAFAGLSLLAALHVIRYTAAPSFSPFVYILFIIAHGMAVHLIPCLLLSVYVLTTTTVSEFISGMKKWHVPDTVTIPLSVIFRFFPTVLEEIRSINQAMSMRGIRLGSTRPGKIMEYRVIPTMMCSLKIGDELSAAALSRGLGSPVTRTSVCHIRLRLGDYLLMSLCFAAFILWLLSKAGVYLW